MCIPFWGDSVFAYVSKMLTVSIFKRKWLSNGLWRYL